MRHSCRPCRSGVGRQLPIMVPASTMFSVYWEWQLCPKTAVQNYPSPAPESCAWGRVKFWIPEILASWVICEDVSFSVSQFHAHEWHCENPASTLRPVADVATATIRGGPGSGPRSAPCGPEWHPSRAFPARGYSRPDRPPRPARGDCIGRYLGCIFCYAASVFRRVSSRAR